MVDASDSQRPKPTHFIIMVNGLIGKTSMKSNFDLSKVHINPELEEVATFRKSLIYAVNEIVFADVSLPKFLYFDKECMPWIAGSIVALNNVFTIGITIRAGTVERVLKLHLKEDTSVANVIGEKPKSK
ncbi:hypothetical protein PIB30_064154 [Stylosanthes scabra]|uniref:Uncharacterized protein n=1 Tax=Stylosanthes scabra TaxID=79078 RepID=A0ABU6UMN7_9FABA|nr:hypothetical protein [Stylosanthes scabra]